MFEAKGISYYYRKRGFGISDVNLRLEDGYFAVLLGKNGAGKTTLLRTLYQMYAPKKGELFWNGEKITRSNLDRYRTQAAYIEDGDWCISQMSGAENVELFGKLYERFNERDFRENLDRLDAGEHLLEQPYHSLSKGEQMKLQISFVLARDPGLLFMDEPFANLDPVVKTDFMEIFHQRVTQGRMSVLMSTHLLEDVTDIADYIGIMEDGRMRIFADREEALSRCQTENMEGLFLNGREGAGLWE